jgi:hypothetical protein
VRLWKRNQRNQRLEKRLAQEGKNHIVSPSIRGELYRPSCGCSVPPWEACDCSHLLTDPVAERLNAELDERLNFVLWDEAADKTEAATMQ